MCRFNRKKLKKNVDLRVTLEIKLYRGLGCQGYIFMKNVQTNSKTDT